MRTPSPPELLEAWDECAPLAPAGRPGLLLSRAAGLTADQIAALPLGECTRLLIEVRRRLFGELLPTVVDCPGCGLRLTAELAAAAFLATGRGPESIEVAADGFRVRCREPRAGDLADAAATGSVPGARELLIARTVVSAECDGTGVPAADLPEAVLAAVAQALDRAYPLLDIDLPFTCADCGHSWHQRFDIGSYLWQEVDAWAARACAEVHALASAYGWSEADILALTPARRQRYLELVDHG